MARGGRDGQAAGLRGGDLLGKACRGLGRGEPPPADRGPGARRARGNRTGRIFTGDRSGDWLFASLYRTGFAVQETSVHAGDGQRLVGARMLASVRCAPPANKPLPEEKAACYPWLQREIELVADSVRVVVALGGYAWQAMWPALKDAGYGLPRSRPPFGHGVEVPVAYGESQVTLIGCYHPSQQNTFTGRVTAQMLDDIFHRAANIAK
ncbi:uracil-DNA glycosylase family protein [Nonomuraea dietziae]|uniref:uracil-DNA glycosylase family protein n=1 Tax=Nonomuraea dietziae TaxID=65515 RepID=UPI00361703DD